MSNGIARLTEKPILGSGQSPDYLVCIKDGTVMRTANVQQSAAIAIIDYNAMTLRPADAVTLVRQAINAGKSIFCTIHHGDMLLTWQDSLTLPMISSSLDLKNGAQKYIYVFSGWGVDTQTENNDSVLYELRLTEDDGTAEWGELQIIGTDSAPAANSENFVTSAGVKNYVDTAIATAIGAAIGGIY